MSDYFRVLLANVYFIMTIERKNQMEIVKHFRIKEYFDTFSSPLIVFH